MAIIATEATVEVENTVGTATAFTAITQANPAVVTATAHGLTSGDYVKMVVSDGMVEIDQQVARVGATTTGTFELEGVNSTNFSAFATGTNTWQEVTAWYTVAASTAVDIGNASPTEIDGTRLIDKKQVTLYGLPGSISGTIDIHHDPHSSAIQKLKSATTSDLLAFRVTWSNGNICTFGAQTAYSGGWSAALNSIVTGNIPVTVPADLVEYPS